MRENCTYISKLDAARRQLDVAIKLFFSYGDIVATHTLTAASYNIMRDLAQQQEKTVFLKQEMLDHIKPEYHQKVINAINKPENFFKHADRDASSVLDFNPEVSETLLWDACRTYKLLTTEETPLIKIFNMWFYAKNPDILMDNEVKKNVIRLNSEMGLDFNNRGTFLALLPDIIKRYF